MKRLDKVAETTKQTGWQIMKKKSEKLEKLIREPKELGVVLLAPSEEGIAIDGLQCRVWRGKTLDGKLMIAFVYRIMMDENDFAESYLAKILEPAERPSSYR